MEQYDQNQGQLTIVDAIETLSEIAEMKFDKVLDIAEKNHLCLPEKRIEGAGAENVVSLALIKKVFAVILSYLEQFYKTRQNQLSEEKEMEGVREIMHLVGAAAHKLNSYTNLFKTTQAKKITDLEEYKRLQDFYLQKVTKKIDEGMLSEWLLGLSKTFFPKQSFITKKEELDQTSHVFVEMDSVKKDTEYELFYIKKENGSRFFNPRLIRSAKLACDFGDAFVEGLEYHDELSLEIWKDRNANWCARQILKTGSAAIQDICKSEYRSTKNSLLEMLKKSFFALFLAANPNNLSHNIPLKNCYDYLRDYFQYFRECLDSSEWRSIVAKEPNHRTAIEKSLLNCIGFLSFVLYTKNSHELEFASFVNATLDSAQEKNPDHAYPLLKRTRSISESVHGEYEMLLDEMKKVHNGPLHLLMQVLDGGDYHQFDPLLMLNAPTECYSFINQGKLCKVIRCPCPTTQEHIQKATINPEFTAFLDYYKGLHLVQPLVLFNFQDNVSWKEHARAQALENLQNDQRYSQFINIITLPRDTEFYHQESPYHRENQAEAFKQLLKKQILSTSCGFYFPERVRSIITADFLESTMQNIHEKFFENKNVLSQENRIDFIDLVYLFIQNKIVQSLQPEYLFFVCKDAIDVGGIAATQYFIFQKLMHHEQIGSEEVKKLHVLLYGPSLLNRERLPIKERFDRLVSSVKRLEGNPT